MENVSSDDMKNIEIPTGIIAADIILSFINPLPGDELKNIRHLKKLKSPCSA